jgi:hypothetical protein
MRLLKLLRIEAEASGSGNPEKVVHAHLVVERLEFAPQGLVMAGLVDESERFLDRHRRSRPD